MWLQRFLYGLNYHTGAVTTLFLLNNHAMWISPKVYMYLGTKGLSIYLKSSMEQCSFKSKCFSENMYFIYDFLLRSLKTLTKWLGHTSLLFIVVSVTTGLCNFCIVFLNSIWDMFFEKLKKKFFLGVSIQFNHSSYENLLLSKNSP